MKLCNCLQESTNTGEKARVPPLAHSLSAPEEEEGEKGRDSVSIYSLRSMALHKGFRRRKSWGGEVSVERPIRLTKFKDNMEVQT